MNARKRAAPARTTVGDIDAEVLAYTAGRDLELDRALIEADCLGTAAHAATLARLPLRPPILSAADVRRIRAALREVVREAAAGAFTIGPEDQDVHLALERRLTERLGELGRRIHTARSRNDQVAVDLRLFARGELAETLAETAELARALVRFARRHAAVPMVGRTHQQPAMPSSVGLWASAHAESLLDDAALLLAAEEINNQCPLGAAAGYGVPLPLDRRYTARILGFGRATHNVLYAIHSRGKIESVILDALAQVMLTLSRLAQDLIQYAMPEFGYFRMPAAFGTGSSIMPQKNNPDVLELVRARAARVMAAASLVREILRAAPAGYNRDVQETKEPFMDGFAVTRASLRVLAPLIRGTTVNRAALRRAFEPSVFAADRALELAVAGVPFRDAYHRVKAGLDEWAGVAPEEALACKTHWGAPAGLDFAALDARVREAAKLARESRRHHTRVAARLLRAEGGA